MDKFRCYRIFEENGKGVGRLDEMALEELDPGPVVVKVDYSSVNFKDALTARGLAKVVYRYPCVGGCDASGTVEASSDPRFKVGDKVVSTGYDLAKTHDGGYAPFMRVPGDWLVPVPKSLTVRDTMALGTAGYTAALAIDLLERSGLRPDKGKVVVNGATGGCGSVAIDMLARRGYDVTALTGKASEHEYLKALGATRVVGPEALPQKKRPLDKPVWAAAFDNIGGEQLEALIRSMESYGLIAAIGNAGGNEVHTTVLPFILRGIQLIGVTSAWTPAEERLHVWERIATDLRPRHLDDMVQTITLDELDATFDRMLQRQTRGRIVVDLTRTAPA